MNYFHHIFLFRRNSKHCVLLSQNITCPPIHSVIGCRYFHGITLRDNPPFHPLSNLDAGKNLRVMGKKNTKSTQCNRRLTLHTFSCP